MNKQILVVIIMLLLTILYSCEKDNIEFDKSEYYLDKRDDKRYKIKQIGEEYWFLENLNYNNEGSTWYSNVEEYGDIYGRLYNWESAITACPPGWHLPTDEEWQKLEQYAGMTVQQSNSESWRGNDEGRKLKSKDSWASNGNGDDLLGFNVLAAGFVGISGKSQDLGKLARFWTSTKTYNDNSYTRMFQYTTDSIRRSSTGGHFLKMSVRCVKN